MKFDVQRKLGISPSNIVMQFMINVNGLICSPVSFQTTSTDSIMNRVESVGKVQPHVTAKLVSPSGEVVPIGTPGQILISGYLLQKG
jgi:acyl-CoA synthetase (AMP-forming)/AMP-acid ligase II